MGDIYEVVEKVRIREEAGVALDKIVLTPYEGTESTRSKSPSPGDMFPPMFWVQYMIKYEDGEEQQVWEKYLRIEDGTVYCGAQPLEKPIDQDSVAFARMKLRDFAESTAKWFSRLNYDARVSD